MSYIEFRLITKSYGDNLACQGISFSVESGSIHAVIGENGAGKSTLMKIFGGLQAATSGEMFLNSKAYFPQSAQDAFKNKIGFVHQHFLLAENRTVLEHLILNWPKSSLFRPISTESILKKVNLFLEKFRWKLNLKSLISELSVGEQQRIEIIKALLTDPEIIIFDEPTAVLAPQEVTQFLQFLKQLQSEKKTILLISHKLSEIKTVSDAVTILRHGKSILTKKTCDLSIEEMAENMIGRKLQNRNQNHRVVENLETPTLFNLGQLEFKTNQILGIAGIEGHGQSELITAVLDAAKKNAISTADIAEDRLKYALFPSLSLIDHMVLRHPAKFTTGGFVATTVAREATDKTLKTWDVRPRNSQLKIENFSGGNQQKFVVGRELMHDADFILAAHPSRGVDLGAQEMIHSALESSACVNKSVLLISSDLDEILKLSAEFCILCEKNLYGPFRRSHVTEIEIGQLMTGSHPQQAQFLMKGVL